MSLGVLASQRRRLGHRQTLRTASVNRVCLGPGQGASSLAPASGSGELGGEEPGAGCESRGGSPSGFGRRCLWLVRQMSWRRASRLENRHKERKQRGVDVGPRAGWGGGEPSGEGYRWLGDPPPARELAQSRAPDPRREAGRPSRPGPQTRPSRCLPALFPPRAGDPAALAGRTPTADRAPHQRFVMRKGTPSRCLFRTEGQEETNKISPLVYLPNLKRVTFLIYLSRHSLCA